MTHDPLLPEMTGRLIAAMDGDIAPSSLRTLARRLIAQVRSDERLQAAGRGQDFIRRNVYAKPWQGTADDLVQGVLAAVRGDSC